MSAACFDCNRPYGDEHGFPDLVIPNDIWRRISPSGDEGGLLCPSCLCRRAHDAGVECEARFASGPFRPSEPRAKTLDDIREFKSGTPSSDGVALLRECSAMLDAMTSRFTSWEEVKTLRDKIDQFTTSAPSATPAIPQWPESRCPQCGTEHPWFRANRSDSRGAVK